MTLAELEQLKERKRLCGLLRPEPAPERKPAPPTAPLPEITPTFDLYGEIIARSEMPT